MTDTPHRMENRPKHTRSRLATAPFLPVNTDSTLCNLTPVSYASPMTNPSSFDKTRFYTALSNEQDANMNRASSYKQAHASSSQEAMSAHPMHGFPTDPDFNLGLPRPTQADVLAYENAADQQDYAQRQERRRVQENTAMPHASRWMANASRKRLSVSEQEAPPFDSILPQPPQATFMHNYFSTPSAHDRFPNNHTMHSMKIGQTRNGWTGYTKDGLSKPLPAVSGYQPEDLGRRTLFWDDSASPDRPNVNWDRQFEHLASNAESTGRDDSVRWRTSGHIDIPTLPASYSPSTSSLQSMHPTKPPLPPSGSLSKTSSLSIAHSDHDRFRDNRMANAPQHPSTVFNWWKKADARDTERALERSAPASQLGSADNYPQSRFSDKRNTGLSPSPSPTTPEPDHTSAEKRAPDAFLVFCSDARHEIKAVHPKIRTPELDQLLWQQWETLSDERRLHYKHQADLVKETTAQNRENDWRDDPDFTLYQPPPKEKQDMISITNDQETTMDEYSSSNSRSRDHSPSGMAWDVNVNTETTTREFISPPVPMASLSVGPSTDLPHASVVSVASHSAAAEAAALASLTLGRGSGRTLPGQPERLKRPPNAYLLFNRDMRHRILQDHPSLSVPEISKLISERWKQLPEEERESYNQKAALLKQKHVDDHPHFIYSRRSKAELLQAGVRCRPSTKRVKPTPTTPKPDRANRPRDPRGRKKKKIRHPTAPKHPMSGFLYFSSYIRTQVVADMPPTSSVGDVSKVIAARWRTMTPEERKPYLDMAKRDKERYAREIRAYMEEQASSAPRARTPSMSPDSHTIATVSQMVNPRNKTLVPALPTESNSRDARTDTIHNYQLLPASPPATLT